MNTSEKSAIKGKHIAITGILMFYKRSEAFDRIRDLGGIPQENVTKETDYLVVGHYRKNSITNGKSNKRMLAERYISQGCSIRIIKEDMFLPMLWLNEFERNRSWLRCSRKRYLSGRIIRWMFLSLLFYFGCY